MKKYLSQMLYALTSAYSRKDYDNVERNIPLETNIGKLFSVLAWGLDTVQEQAEAIRLWDDIDNARGAVLDRYGANFGVKRFGADDIFYRLTIKVKMLSQLSGGDIDTVLAAASALFGVPADSIWLNEIFPAKIGIDVIEADLTPETLAIVADITILLKRIVAAGIGLVATLQAYRSFEETIDIRTAAFDYSKMLFDLYDARRSFINNIKIRAAAFNQSRMVFGLYDARRSFVNNTEIKAAVFGHSRIIFEPSDGKCMLAGAVGSRTAVFGHSRITFVLYNARSIATKTEVCRTPLFEYTRLVFKQVN